MKEIVSQLKHRNPDTVRRFNPKINKWKSNLLNRQIITNKITKINIKFE